MTHGGMTTIRRLTTQLVLARWVAVARLRGVRLHVKAHPDARVGAGATLAVSRGKGSNITLEMGAQSHIESGALVRLAGGASVRLGPRSVIRRFAVLNISGDFAMCGDNLLSWHSVVHCAERVVFERQAGTGEGVTVVDGKHFRRDETDHWYRNNTTAPIAIGANVWIASHSTIGPGVRIGDATTVAAGSIVLADVPGNALVAGSPASVVREGINASASADRGAQ